MRQRLQRACDLDHLGDTDGVVERTVVDRVAVDGRTDTEVIVVTLFATVLVRESPPGKMPTTLRATTSCSSDSRRSESEPVDLDARMLAAIELFPRPAQGGGRADDAVERGHVDGDRREHRIGGGRAAVEPGKPTRGAFSKIPLHG